METTSDRGSRLRDVSSDREKIFGHLPKAPPQQLTETDYINVRSVNDLGLSEFDGGTKNTTTEMREIKHAYRKKTEPRKGVDS